MQFRKAKSNPRKKKLLVDTQHNNPVGADWRGRLLLLQSRSVAAQPERWTEVKITQRLPTSFAKRRLCRNAATPTIKKDCTSNLFGLL